MCGRYALHANPEVVALQFGLEALPEFKASYNVCPGSDVLVVRQRRKAALLRGWNVERVWLPAYACPVLVDGIALGGQAIASSRSSPRRSG